MHTASHPDPDPDPATDPDTTSHAPEAGKGAGAETRHRPGALLAALLTAVGSYALMQTMVVPALPVLTRQLDADASTAGWLVTAFLLGSAVLTPVVSALGDRYGHRRMLLLSLAVYLAGTVGAALAPGIGVLIVMRAVEGISMATLPLALTVIRESMPRERRVGAFGLTSAMIGGGSGAGLVVGGLLIETFSWRWMFAAEAVLIAAAIGLTAALVPDVRPRHTSTGRVDAGGALALAGALSTLLLGITRGNSWGWASPGVLGLFGAALALFALLALVETRHARPLVNLRTLAHPAMLLTHVAALLVGAIPFLFYILLPAVLQTSPAVAPYGNGLSVVASGLLLLPSALCVMLAGRTAPWLRARLGPRAPLAASMLLMTAGSVALALWHTGPAAFGILFCLVGLGSGYGFAALADLVATLAPRGDLAAANGLNTVVRTVGSAVGGQVATVLLLSFTLRGTSTPSQSAFTTGYWLAAALGCLGIVVAAALRPRPHEPEPAAVRVRPREAAAR